MANILLIDRVRRKNKSFWDYFTVSWYYESENISLKEKVYTFYYNMRRTGVTTKGEVDWSMRMRELDFDGWKKLELEFNKDYQEFINRITI